MRMTKVLLILTAVCTLLAAGYAQTSNAQTGPEAVNGQDVNPKPSNSGGDAATDALPNSRNNPGQAAPMTRPDLVNYGQKRAMPANPAAAAQNPPLPTQAPSPQNVLFEFFFNNMAALNQAAESDDRAGDHASAASWRTHDQRGAGLNDAEGQIMQEIVRDCLRALKEQDVKIRAGGEKFRAQLKPGAPIVIAPELVQLSEDRKKIVSDHIERLREALGDASFNKLDIYIHATFHVEMIAPKSAPSSTTIIEKSK